MAYEVIYDPDEDCVLGRIEGQVDLALVHEYGKEIIRQLRAHHCLRFLNDMRQASGTLSTVDIYDLPAWIEEAGMDRSCKRRCSWRGTSTTMRSLRRSPATTARW